MSLKRLTFATGAAVGAAALAYPLLLRRWCLTWGATHAEVAAPMAGDDLLPEAPLVVTRAVSIDAPPEDVWPWLAQMGSGRGGAYTYDWIENLMGLDMHSADEVLQQFQDIAVGDQFPLGPNGPAMHVAVADPPTALVYRHEDGNWIWSFQVSRQGHGSRLVSRNRIDAPTPNVASRLGYMLLMEPGSLVMERKMLLGIKRRAERLRSRQAQPAPS
jgi:hypothetical protein